MDGLIRPMVSRRPMVWRRGGLALAMLVAVTACARNRIERGADDGWPACVGDRRPLESVGVAAEDQPDAGGDRQRCEDTVVPVAEFGPGATAPSGVVSPFADGAFIVALWMAGKVVSVAADGSGASAALVAGPARPQHLLTDGDTLLVPDHARGTIHRITADRQVPRPLGVAPGAATRDERQDHDSSRALGNHRR